MDSSADGDSTTPTSEEPAEDTPAGTAANNEETADNAKAETDTADATDNDEELDELRATVEEKYDFDEFGPAEMAQMSGDEWEAAFDPETWITGKRLLDRVESDLKSKIAAREIFAVVERDDSQLVVYADTGYAVVSADGTVDGEGGVRRDVEPVVAMCSMDEYEVSEPPANYELPAADQVPEQTGEFGNLMIQLIAGGQVIGGSALLGAFILRLVETVVAPVVGGLFLIVGIGLFALVANARLSDRFRAEQYRSRLRAVEAGGIDRPEIEGDDGTTTDGREPAQRADTHETEAS
ncbi:DUF7319 domain-containing protein [Halonotius pteroides]|uniref:DUF7319 domain-containing protein n=1 Tax=Halonotius pteroides TaxID=268735 RepID=A0A3A6Q4U6_9EURY|nr:phage holin family protein [Halonotius pteroides]RJX49383.1 hypothetical protein DP106_09305 [Halonotius pteroides]